MNPQDVGAPSKSAALYERAKHSLPGGVSRNTVLRSPHPLYADYASGCRVTDIEGVERIDFANNMASLIHGHAHPKLVSAVSQQLERGSAFTLGTEIEVLYAEHLCQRNPDAFERLRFVNSGTEAVMGAIKATRAFTGRSKIAKAEGAYHGLYDYAEVSQMATPDRWGPSNRPKGVPVAQGTPQGALDDVIIFPYNDIECALDILNEHKDELACVVLDLLPHRIGLRPGDSEFVKAIREWTHKDGSLLLFDEVITFRSTYGGAQNWYDGVVPDLTALGKIIGGGFPVGAITGKAEVMNVMNPLEEKLRFPHSGTFSANPITMTAGLMAMELFDQKAVEHCNGLNDRAMRGVTQAIEETGVRACVTGGGSMFRVHLKESPPVNYREAFMTPDENKKLKVLLDHLFDSGFMMINTCTATMSTPMTESDIDALVASMKTGFEKLVEMDRQ